MAELDDDHGSTLNKKIRSAQLTQYNYIFGERHTQIVLSDLMNKLNLSLVAGLQC